MFELKQAVRRFFAPLVPVFAIAVAAAVILVGSHSNFLDTPLAALESIVDRPNNETVHARTATRPDAGETTTVAKITDGDTLHVASRSAPVRLIGIDAPEIAAGNAECGGAEAASYLESLIPPGTQVTLVFDQELTDRWGRNLAYVYRHRDGLFVNLAMVSAGWAHAQEHPPNSTHAHEFASAETHAADTGIHDPNTCS